MNAVHQLCTIYMFHFIITDVTLFLTLFTMITFEQLRQAEVQHLQRPGRFNGIRLHNFLSSHCRSVQNIMSINRIYSRMLLLFFLINYPLNAECIMLLLHNKSMSLAMTGNACSYLMYQFHFIFAIHFLATGYSNRIHRFTKPMMHIYVHQGLDRKQSLGCVFRMCVYIEQFHSTKRLGLTYGPLGVISFLAFLKFTFLYVRFMFYFYTKYN